MKYLILIGLVLLAGCTTKEIIYQNQTILKETIIEKEEVKLTCPDCPQCPDMNCYEPECKTSIKSVITDDCTKKLNMCNIRVDAINEHLFECLVLNNTLNADNLTDQLDECQEERKEFEDKLNNISNLI